jgi:II/X family phage/plasmid replication protein
MRLDLCYAWKLAEEYRAERILDILQNFTFSKKKKYMFDSSVMYVGKTYSLKFYLKYPEFFKHDFKFLKDLGHLNFAYSMLNNARGVIRFEATLRSQYLHYHFEKPNIYMKDLTRDKLMLIMVLLFNKYMGGFPIKYTDKVSIKKQLQDYWGLKKGGRLWVFYIYLISEGRENLKDIYSSSTIYQYIRELREAGISLSFQNINFDDFKLSIPSPDCVNNIEESVIARKGITLKRFCGSNTQ